MTHSIHPWTMYEVARYRDEERQLRAEEARRALKSDSAEARGDSSKSTSAWLDRVRLASLFEWARGHHLRPVRHV